MSHRNVSPTSINFNINTTMINKKNLNLNNHRIKKAITHKAINQINQINQKTDEPVIIDNNKSEVNINNYFDMIYVINLVSRVDRKQTIENRLKDRKITNYQIFPATVGKNNPMYTYYQHVKGFMESAGAFGVLSSAARVLNDAVKNKYKRILILEDDAIFHKNFDIDFQKRINLIPQDWKLLYFGTSMHKWRFAERCHINKDKGYLTAQGTIAGAFAVGIDSSVYADLLIDLNITNKPMNLFQLQMHLQ